MSQPVRPPAPTRLVAAFPFPPVVMVHPWPDPLLDRFGHDPRSTYVERFWLPIIGPSGTLLLRRLADGFDDEPEGYVLDLREAARALGMGRREGPTASFRRTVERVVSFGFARFGDPGTLAVRSRLPGLTRRQHQRLSPALRDDHDRWQESQTDDEIIGARVEHLAVSLLQLGEEPAAVEDHLLRLDFHPVVVQQALAVATERTAPLFGNDAA